MSLFRPELDRISGYVPGEQPRESGWTKLNTNENPYPPSPRVVEAIINAAHGKLNLYPDPLGTDFRKAAAEVCGVDPDWILPGNGSDEVLTILTRSFATPQIRSRSPTPVTSFTKRWPICRGARRTRLLLNPDWSWDFAKTIPIVEQCKLVFIPNPNSPSGHRWTWDDLISVTPSRGVLVLDEAYGDFADFPHRGELLNSTIGHQIVVTRTFSKSYSLAGIRFGYAIAHPSIIAGLRKMKDSYNCDSLSLAAATAAIQDQDWMQANVSRVRATRDRLTSQLTAIGYHVVPSQANFVWATHPTGEHKAQYEALRTRKILVRYMAFHDVSWAKDQCLDGLRITIGTDADIDTLVMALKEIV